jgi:hypothetical protein
MSKALAPLRRCSEILRAVSTGIGSPWTPDQAASWRRDAITLVDLGSALARVQQRWGSDPAQWLTFGMTLAMSQRILAEVGRPLDPAERG